MQVAPFDDTPNNGGEYKLWITRKSDYEANGSFKPGSIKHVLAADAPEAGHGQADADAPGAPDADADRLTDEHQPASEAR